MSSVRSQSSPEPEPAADIGFATFGSEWNEQAQRIPDTIDTDPYYWSEDSRDTPVCLRVSAGYCGGIL